MHMQKSDFVGTGRALSVSHWRQLFHHVWRFIPLFPPLQQRKWSLAAAADRSPVPAAFSHCALAHGGASRISRRILALQRPQNSLFSGAPRASRPQTRRQFSQFSFCLSLCTQHSVPSTLYYRGLFIPPSEITPTITSRIAPPQHTSKAVCPIREFTNAYSPIRINAPITRI